MTFRTMKVFKAVVENGSMQGAARTLFISVPSVSEVISDFEKEFGQKLFERLNHKLYITAAGTKLYDYVNRIINLQQEMQDQMDSSTGLNCLHIGATVSIGSSILFPILNSANLNCSNVIINNTLNIEEKLLSNDLDIALVEGSIHNKYLVVKPFAKDELVLVCDHSHPFATREFVSLSELASFPILIREEGSGTREKLLDSFKLLNLKPNVIWESSCVNSIIKAVSNRLGVTVMSSRLVPPDLVTVKLLDFDGSRMFSLVWHKDKYFSDAMKNLVQACENII